MRARGLDAELARVQAQINALNAIPEEKQRTKDFEALAGLEKERDALEGVIESVRTAAAEKARLAELNRNAKLSEIELAEAMASGDAKRIAQIQWSKNRNEAHQAGLKDDEAVRYANAKSAEAGRDIEAKKEALALEIKLSEAKAAGNEKERRRLEWINEYKRVLAETTGLGLNLTDADAAAKRSANAKDAGDAGDGGLKESGLAQKVTAYSSNSSATQFAALAESTAMGHIARLAGHGKADAERTVASIDKLNSAITTKLDAVKLAVENSGGRF